ncbi:rhodanese-like domain-containing protein [Myxococcota bacterium]|nr:rhodanese-like domain-containing protein [Myxococcota bacterium]
MIDKQLKRLGAAAMLLGALAILLIGDPTLADQLQAAAPDLDARLASRAHHVDPWEVYEAMHNNRMKLILLDVRQASDYNLFHLAGARRVEASTLAAGYPLKATAVVIMSNDEAEAERAWRRLWVQGQKNAYIMEGGVNLWLDIFRPELCALTKDEPGVWLLDTLHLNPCHAYGHHPHFNAQAKRVEGADTPRHRFARAFGATQPWAAPPALHGEGAHARRFEHKIKLIGGAAKKAGGCG